MNIAIVPFEFEFPANGFVETSIPEPISGVTAGVLVSRQKAFMDVAIRIMFVYFQVWICEH
jgi:hypothetical protein